jgi:MerR family transcriptional regulator, copper efflux regulator
MMLIKAFCVASGLPRETVRFYVRKGLLKPEIGTRPGNRYQVFDENQVERAHMIRAAQAIGFSLKEVAALAATYEREGIGPSEKSAILKRQLERLNERQLIIANMQKYIADKIERLS